MLFFMEILLVAPVVQAVNATLLIRSRDALLPSNVAMSVTTTLRQPGAMTRPDALLRTTTVFEKRVNRGSLHAQCTQDKKRGPARIGKSPDFMRSRGQDLNLRPSGYELPS